MHKRKINWQKYFLEFLSIFIGVSLAFVLSKWNEDRKEYRSEDKTLLEIRNGLEQDLEDAANNLKGHQRGLAACNYFRDLIEDRLIAEDSIQLMYFALLRDYISIQNKTGYESLKSKGLELVRDDSLRFAIISLYDFYYEILEKLEEKYSEMQFNQNYYKDINALLSPYMEFDREGQLTGIAKLQLSERERNQLLSYLWRIEQDRRYVIKYYHVVLAQIESLITQIDQVTE